MMAHAPHVPLAINAQQNTLAHDLTWHLTSKNNAVIMQLGQSTMTIPNAFQVRVIRPAVHVASPTRHQVLSLQEREARARQVQIAKEVTCREQLLQTILFELQLLQCQTKPISHRKIPPALRQTNKTPAVAAPLPMPKSLETICPNVPSHHPSPMQFVLKQHDPNDSLQQRLSRDQQHGKEVVFLDSPLSPPAADPIAALAQHPLLLPGPKSCTRPSFSVSPFPRTESAVEVAQRKMLNISAAGPLTAILLQHQTHTASLPPSPQSPNESDGYPAMSPESSSTVPDNDAEDVPMAENNFIEKQPYYVNDQPWLLENHGRQPSPECAFQGPDVLSLVDSILAECLYPSSPDCSFP